MTHRNGSERFEGVSLRVTRELSDAAVVVHAAGAVALGSAPALGHDLTSAEATAIPPAPVIVDLTCVQFFGAAGLATLVEHYRRCTEQSTPLRVVADRRSVLRPLHVCGLDRLLSVFPSVPEALRAAA